MTTTHRPPGPFLVVRAWRQLDGRLCTRVGTPGDPLTGATTWQACVGVERTLVVVRHWLDRWAGEPGDGPTSERHP